MDDGVAEDAIPAAGGVTPRQRRSAVVRALLRALLTATLLLVLYYVLPMDSALDTHTVFLLALCMLIFAVLIAWRLREITRSEYPGLRAIETLAAVVPLYILAFATTYFLLEQASSADFSQPLTRSGALYFSVTVFSTVGFGDITAKTDPARLIVTAQMFLDLILLGFGARAFVSAVSLGRQRRGRRLSAGHPHAAGSPRGTRPTGDAGTAAGGETRGQGQEWRAGVPGVHALAYPETTLAMA